MLKKNWYLFTPLALILIPGLLMAHYTLNVGYAPGDAWNATRYFFQSGTRYTMKYSEDHFRRVRPGMDGRQVYEMMGVQPFERHDNDARWIYSLPKSGATAYHERVVLMERDKNNVPRVKEAIKRFHRP